jgi:hypothetical protein
VVDPNLNGKVKITVIATGFDKASSARAVPAAALQTPVDLSNYTAHLNAAAAPAGAVAREPQAAPSSAAFSAPLTVSRRPPLELGSLPLAAAAAGASPDDHNFELNSPLDVPAFLRRQS